MSEKTAFALDTLAAIQLAVYSSSRPMLVLFYLLVRSLRPKPTKKCNLPGSIVSVVRALTLSLCPQSTELHCLQKTIENTHKSNSIALHDMFFHCSLNCTSNFLSVLNDSNDPLPQKDHHVFYNLQNINIFFSFYNYKIPF